MPGRKRVATGVLTLVVLACGPQLLAAEATASALRNGPFIQSVLGDRATVLWFSDADEPGTVRYGLSPEKLDRSAESNVRSIPEKARRKARFAHEAVLTGLPAGRDIYYRLTAPADPKGVARFRSAPGPESTIRFIPAGDEVYFDPYLPFLEARDLRPDFLIDCGDYQSRVYRYGRPWWREIPVYIAWGNHNDPEREKHLWALPGDKVSYRFEYGPAFFHLSFCDGPDTTPTEAPWRIAAEHPEMISNGKGANNTSRAAKFTAAGYELRVNGNDHRFDRTYPVDGPRRDRTGTVFMTHGGTFEDTKVVHPAISNYYVGSGDSCCMLPIVTVSPERLQIRVLLHLGEKLPREDWPEDWPEDAAPPRDYPHEWDYYVRVKDPAYTERMLETLRKSTDAGKPDAQTSAVVRELGGLVEPRAVEPLTDLLSKTRDTDLRREIALALDRIGQPAAMPAMKALAGDRNPMTRIAVARFFAKFGDQEDAADLAGFLGDDVDIAGRRGPLVVSPQKYYVQGLMLRVGGAQARRLAPEVFEIGRHYAGCVLRMLAGEADEHKRPVLRDCVDRVPPGEKKTDLPVAWLTDMFGPLARGEADVARLVRLAERLGKRRGWQGVAAGLARNNARAHTRLLVEAYRGLSPKSRRSVPPAKALRGAIQDLTGLDLPDPVTGEGRKVRLEPAKLAEGAALAEAWCTSRQE